MFKAAETGCAVSSAEMSERVPQLRQQLLEAQRRMRQVGVPMLLVFGGVDGAGKVELANTLSAWMDPRWISTHAYGAPTPRERARPVYWRYWRDVPAKGYTGVYLGAWHHDALIDRAYGRINVKVFRQRLERMVAFERSQVAEGALILKFWLHLGSRQQAKRFKELEADPLQAWKVAELDWKHLEMYESFVETSKALIKGTNSEAASWTLVEGECPNHRDLSVGLTILNALEQRLAGQAVRVPSLATT